MSTTASASCPSRSQSTSKHVARCPDFSKAIHEAREKSTKRRNRPQSWIVRKLAIGLVVGFVGYGYYVYVVTFCIPMIQRHRNALANRRIGIAFLVTFNILFLMFVWAYVKVVLTSPGYAREHTHKTPPPVSQAQSRNPEIEQPFQIGNNDSVTEFHSHLHDSNTEKPHHHHYSNSTAETALNDGNDANLNDPGSPEMAEADPYSRLHPDLRQQHAQEHETFSSSPVPIFAPASSVFAPVVLDIDDNDDVSHPQINPTHAQPHPPSSSHATVTNSGAGAGADTAGQPAPAPQTGNEPRNMSIENGLPPPVYARRPPTHPVLSPEFRYCPRDGFIKPMRSHHCSACGTCVLKYDHHCPWIGQCVGAHNQKFFINFLQWASLFTLFIFTTVLAMYARLAAGILGTPRPPVNPQHFIILGLSFLFSLFPVLLFMNQFYLVVYNMTTVEHLHIHQMREREKSMLDELFGSGLCCSSSNPNSAPTSTTSAPNPIHLFSSISGPSHTRATRTSRPRSRSQLGPGSGPDNADFKRPRRPWQAILLRTEIRKQWDQEWGNLTTEGNIWWLGSKRANWEAVMGKSKWGWFLPIGQSLGDGLDYPRNPRFDPDGRWRRRFEWPDGLQ